MFLINPWFILVLLTDECAACDSITAPEKVDVQHITVNIENTTNTIAFSLLDFIGNHDHWLSFKELPHRLCISR